MKKKILLSLLVLVALFTVTGCGGKKESSKKKVDGRTVINYNSAFFINDGGKYALFSDSGKKLTDFEFTYGSTFINGAALVKNADGQSGVIDTNGKMVIPFGKYKYVYQEAGLYKVTDEERNTYLLNAKGKQIADLKDKSLTTYIGVSEYSFMLDKEKEEYSILNSNGDAILKFARGKSDDKPETNSEKNYLSVYHDGKNYVVDLITEKKVLEFDADKHFCVNNASDDGKIITMNSCVGTFQRQDKTFYKFIKDGKLYDLSDKCDSVSLNSGNLICSKDSKNYLLNDKLEVGASIDGTSYTDATHYAKAKAGSFNGIDFYEGDKVVKNVECRTMHEYGYSKSGLVILTTYFSKPCGTESGTYEFYNQKGEKMFDKSFSRATKFDSNGLAKVSEDKVNFYLIDTKGKKVTDEYASIIERNSYYLVTKDGKVGVLDKAGKVVIEAKYKNVDSVTSKGVQYFKLTTEDSKYIIYNAETKKEVYNSDLAPQTTSDYMVVTKDGKNTYYTYTGKEFYSEK